MSLLLRKSRKGGGSSLSPPPFPGQNKSADKNGKEKNRRRGCEKTVSETPRQIFAAKYPSFAFLEISRFQKGVVGGVVGGWRRGRYRLRLGGRK
ncbi:hypothetical protein CDAR_589371 [Caerostris darwini]|uniref:Uncharacterized protein n=1 Tax=Caerostris darwini TaxID=1538125 RepID=A0AAV4TB96_9ARAC|nr:hypothetical protein CDAR_589371 [Caerostris darwini]